MNEEIEEVRKNLNMALKNNNFDIALVLIKLLQELFKTEQRMIEAELLANNVVGRVE